MSEQSLTDAEIADLRCLAGMMIPASRKYDVPGADDPAIFADIVNSIGRDGDNVRGALATLRTFSGGPLTAVDAARRTEVAAKLRAEGGVPVSVLTRIVMLCYYRDERVMLSLGLEPRAPFPKGHIVEQGDWSLLDPVRARNPFWRQVP
ncbi:MAG TPA: hypothetical protein VL614_02680 [Acetobacteraceae bacterium]|jgi:hypothetical protein|nr:hypothetical protein [Acetobacteraceae bacterium]